MLGEGMWAFVVIAGFVILAVAIVHAIRKNRQETPADTAHTEAATRANYRAESADGRAQDEIDEQPR